MWQQIFLVLRDYINTGILSGVECPGKREWREGSESIHLVTPQIFPDQDLRQVYLLLFIPTFQPCTMENMVYIWCKLYAL